MKHRTIKKLLALCLSGLLFIEPVFASDALTPASETEMTENVYHTTIYFYSNDDTDREVSQDVSSDTQEPLLANTFTRTGFTFTGWNTDEDGLGTPYDDMAEASSFATEETDAGSCELYAQWSLNPIEIKTCKKTSNVSYTISYQKNAGADGYIVEYSTDKSFLDSKKLTLLDSASSCTLVNLTPSKTYYIRVRCYVDSLKRIYSEWSLTQTISVPALSSTKLTSAKTTGVGKIQIKYAKNTKADGYELHYCSNKKFSGGKKISISKKKTSYTLTDLPVGKTYYVRIRCYYKGSNKKFYSAWSKPKSVKLAKPAAPTVKKLKATSMTTAIFTYAKAKNAQKYEIQYSKNKTFKGAKKLTVKSNKTSVTLKDLMPATTYYVRVRSYCKGKKKQYYSSWSKTRSVKTQSGNVILNTASVAAIESDVTLTGSGTGYHAKLVICTATSAVSYGIQYDACAVAPYTGKAMAMIENVASNDAGGQQYSRPGNVELQLGKTYHMMLTIDANGNGGVYLNYKKIGSFSNPSLAHQTLAVRVEGSARRNGDYVKAVFQNIKVKNGNPYDPDHVWQRHEFQTNPTLSNQVDKNGTITISGSISGLADNQDWDNAYGSVSDIIQFW